LGEEEEGVGIMKKIFIIHGWAYETGKWQPLIEILRKTGIEAVLLKVPGLTAPLKEVWTLDNYVEWLGEEVGQEKGKVVLLGHSTGGRIGLAFAAHHPEKVGQLILIDSAGIYHNELRIRMKRFVFGNLAKFGKRFSKAEILRKLLYKLTRESDYEKSDPILRKTMFNLIRTDISDLFSVIEVPTTIIWGEDDTITPLADGRIMNEKIKGSKFFVIREARHSPQFTNAEEVGEIIRGEIN
jgi:pimeloyl-ACP methyl ester carboxylesterase